MRSTDGADTAPSKSELKRQMHALQELGLALAGLPDDRLAAAPMPEALREAFYEFKRTRSHEGRRRQMQYIGKLMRRCDPAPLRQAVADFQLGGAQDTLRLHQTEQWRERLIANPDAITDWMQRFPQSDLPRLRTLVHAAQRDAAAAPEQRHGRGYRDLFQFIKPWLNRVS